MQDEVFMIGNFDDDTITFADFIIDGEKLIPIFLDRAAFDRQDPRYLAFLKTRAIL